MNCSKSWKFINTMKLQILLFFVLSAASACTQTVAFVFTPTTRTTSSSASTATASIISGALPLSFSVQHSYGFTDSTSSTTLYAAQAPLPPESIDKGTLPDSDSREIDPSEMKRMKMHEDVYNFNKFLIDTVYNIICFIYPVRGTSRDYARFYVLETVARVPYFAYLSVLHLRETFGERDLGDKMRTHYAEADNELHHLLIMESCLGGSANLYVFDRILAQTMSFFYYWYVVVIYILSPSTAYHLSELIEDHAYDTYSKYLMDHGDMLKEQPVPAIAMKYYVEDDPYLFDLISTVKEYECEYDPAGSTNVRGQPRRRRRPKLETLYDVFVNVRDDEKEHWKTLCNLVQYGEMEGVTGLENGNGDELVKSTEAEPKSMPMSIPTLKSVMDTFASNTI